MRAMVRSCPLLAACAVIAGLSACGGSGNPDHPTPTPTPTPTPPPPSVVRQVTGFALPENHVAGWYFDISATGTIDATVDYTYADTLLLIYISKGQCTFDQWSNDQCQYVATSFAGGKPRKVTATGQAAGAYTLTVWNVGPQDEAISFQLVFTQAAAAAEAPLASSARPSGEAAFFSRVPKGRFRN